MEWLQRLFGVHPDLTECLRCRNLYAPGHGDGVLCLDCVAELRADDDGMPRFDYGGEG